MALPKMANVEEKVVEFVRDTVQRSTRTIVEGFSNTYEKIVSSISDRTKSIRGLGIGNAASFGLSGSFFEKFGDKLASIFGLDANQKKVEKLLSDIRDTTSERLDSLNKNFKEFIREWKWDREKGNGVPREEENAPPTPPPAPEKKGGWMSWILLLFKDIAALALRAVSVVAIGAAITASITDAIKKWNIGEALGDAMGLNNGVGGILNIIIGNAQETFMQKLARYGTYATAGATIGIVGGLPGMIVGGIIGLATGVIIDWITDWIGKDKIYAFVDELTDKFFSGLDYILGTDVKRIEQRIKDLTKGRGDIEARILFKQKEIKEIEDQIAKARFEGKNVEVQKLTRMLESVKKDLAGFQSEADSYDRRINDLNADIKNQQKGLWSDIQSFASKATRYIFSIPRRASDSILSLFTGDSLVDVWTADTDYIWTKGITQRLGDAVEIFIKNFVNKTIDMVVEFFTVTIPKAFDDISNMIQKKFEEAYNKLIDFATTFADEISFRDFLPEKLGGSEKSLLDRIQEKIKENQKEVLSSNDDSRNRLSESITDNSQKITNNNNNSTNTVNAPVMNQQNVVNRNMNRAPNYSKNLDQTIRSLDGVSSGNMINP
ncbi:hypothetical protein EVB81_081 [Rhizobium phage RHph_I46]|uniref:Uncharacterized protein n=1 Tax=Rhizobium phage RHph_I1_9 TaxID=2509729 RepID=A0A7S5R9D1_9CAUD|nr:hypothetical protein PP936_gp080 [Rhizobium phage RHph_I1_9]QIG69650.1 hypothetical protein EVB81_081 [Rhizobium phage RHph_I46]QIG70931.1 hypothetical protein EVB92_081 [Rhizobium phage RHph_I9]QIG73517.1 hypothetical protein EVC04_080 [Rhizobium phage RHph_I1_9]QIG76270.1 hypothetical protein EVC25_081 [Rhizobium phage RHph_I34]